MKKNIFDIFSKNKQTSTVLLNFYPKYNQEENKQHLFMSDLEFRPIHNFFRVTISSIEYMKDSSSDMISLHIHNNSPFKINLTLGLLGFYQTNATISPTKEKTYRVNNVLQPQNIGESTIRDEELSINNILSNE